MPDDLDISIHTGKDPQGPFPCPRCGHDSPSIKVIHFPIILFLILFIMAWKKTVVACPSCIRKLTFLFLFINLVTMHLASPRYVVIAISYLIRTFIPGHSTDVVETLRSLAANPTV